MPSPEQKSRQTRAQNLTVRKIQKKPMKQYRIKKMNPTR